MSGIDKRQHDFLVEIFGLFLAVKGRLNFLRFGRYGKRGEQGYRSRFSKGLDFLAFNGELVAAQGGARKIVAVDPSYVRKSGKSTPGTGYFWSGVAGAAKWGLEITGIAAVNLAKAAHWAGVPKGERGVFSMADVKTLYHNRLLLDRFLGEFGISPHLPKNREKVRRLLNYGARAA